MEGYAQSCPHKNINGKWYTVVIERVRYWWEVVTAFPRDAPPL
ncbi:hypothetical protein PYCH_05480 [Pyrococcus yayanosii CH1]|uniref:Uncharacterized protein n=1 Tax=Pyrococcus yayanosii (strain CH1 / JCM 16557) TaxID=529709 RepID=F8AHV1_PYRYC|nr:hypothetical protein PYCH_05480 [Pyrococcus yayanosii CH1]